jgi:O-antigen/teichoic acid export membrane protein/glycosyltransferase involved in cell wall biosynthesis
MGTELLKPNDTVLQRASLLRNTAWLAWSGTLTIANSVVIWLLLARWRSAAEVGQFATVMSLQMIFMTVCGLGLTPYLTSQLAHNGDRRRFVSSAALLITLWSGFCSLVMLAAGYYFNPSVAGRQAAYVLSLSLLPTGLISLAEAIFTATGQARVIALATTCENLLRTALPLFLLYRGASLPLICLAFAGVRLAPGVIYLATGLRLFGPLVKPARRWLREIGAVAPAFTGVTLLSALHWQLGTVLAGKLGGEAAAAEFGIAARFLVPVMILLTSYVSVLQPAASRLARQSLPDLGEFLSRCLRLVVALALPLAVGGVTLGMPLLVVLFGTRYAAAAPALGILALSILPFSVVMIAARGLVATGRQRLDLLANAVAVVANLLANLLLIPRWGATGAALAQLFSLTLMAAVEIGYGTRPLFKLQLWGAVWLCRWPLVVMLVVLLLTSGFGFWWTVSLGGLSYLIGLVLLRAELDPSRSGQSQVPAVQRQRIVMIGAHPTKTLGGISTLISDLLQSPLAREFEFKHIVSQVDGGGPLAKLLLALKALGQLIWTLCLWRPALVYVHVGGNASLYRKTVFIGLARLSGLPVMAHFHAGNFAPYFAAQSAWGRQLILRGLGLSHKFIAVSQEMARWLVQLWPQAEVAVIPNGVRTELFTTTRNHTAATPRLLFVGKMGFLKGEADLLRALRQLHDQGVTNWRLDLLGQLSADIHPLIEQLGLAAQIDQCGPVGLHERIGYFQRADVFVLPTYAEGMPLAVLEALAAGLPVLTTPVGGIPELLEDGGAGLLVAPGDVRALALRLEQLLTDPALRLALSERAQRSARRYDLQNTLLQLGAELRHAVPVLPLAPNPVIEKGSN